MCLVCIIFILGTSEKGKLAAPWAELNFIGNFKIITAGKGSFCDIYSLCQIGPLFLPLHYFHSYRDALGVKKKYFKNKIVEFCARIELKLKKLKKTVKSEKKSSKMPVF